MAAIPHESILLNFSAAGIAEAYYKLGETEKANNIAIKLMDVYSQDMEYYVRLDKNELSRLGNEPDIAMSVGHKLYMLMGKSAQELVASGQPEKAKEILNVFYEQTSKSDALLNFSVVGIVETLFELQEIEKANDLMVKLSGVFRRELSMSNGKGQLAGRSFNGDPRNAVSTLQRMILLAREHGQSETQETLEEDYGFLLENLPEDFMR